MNDELDNHKQVDITVTILKVVELVALIWENCFKFNPPTSVSGLVLRESAEMLQVGSISASMRWQDGSCVILVLQLIGSTQQRPSPGWHLPLG